MNNNHDMDIIRANFQDVPALQKVCKKFDFPPEYFPVFTQLHCCGPAHFQNPGVPADIIEQVLESLDYSGHSALINSILSIQNDAIRDTTVMMCSEELLILLYPPSDLDLLDMIVNQIDNLGFLYTKKGFREHMIALYDHFVKPFLADFRTSEPDGKDEAKIPEPQPEQKQEGDWEFPGEEL